VFTSLRYFVSVSVRRDIDEVIGGVWEGNRRETGKKELMISRLSVWKVEVEEGGARC
jgi:hypothetical protein